jgi:trans-aconitate methyltransferase
VTDIREWDAASYHRVANPHVDWGEAVLARLPLQGDETVIDAGCGTGRLTERLLERLPHGHVIAMDQSRNMLVEAEAHLAPRFGPAVTFQQQDLLTLDADAVADFIFSTATFHWITDHDALFATLYKALKPGGWLIAQCGGGPNIEVVASRALTLLREEPYAPYAGSWNGPWHFAGAAGTEAALRRAGFVQVSAEVIHAPVTMPDAASYREFLGTVVLGTHLDRLPDDRLRASFLDRMVELGAKDETPFALDYWRLNLAGQRPGNG